MCFDNAFYEGGNEDERNEMRKINDGGSSRLNQNVSGRHQSKGEGDTHNEGGIAFNDFKG